MNKRQTRRRGPCTLNDGISMLLDDIISNDYEKFFQQPVNLKTTPDYLNFVERPIDMSIIKNKFKKNEYTDLQSLVKDLQLMFNNCFAYNEENALQYLEAKRLQKLMYKTTAKFCNSNAEWAILKPVLKPANHLKYDTGRNCSANAGNSSSTANIKKNSYFNFNTSGGQKQKRADENSAAGANGGRNGDGNANISETSTRTGKTSYLGMSLTLWITTFSPELRVNIL